MFTMPSSSAFYIFFSIALFSVSCFSASNAPNFNPHPFILPIKKDPATNLFYTSLGIGTPRHNLELVIDLAGENLWYKCPNHLNSSSYHHVNCESKKCPKDAICTASGGCNGPSDPGCSASSFCGTNIINPFADSVFGGDLGEDVTYISQLQVPGLLSVCDEFLDDKAVLKDLPKSSKGIVGLARSQLALPTQLALENKVTPKFSLCLPSSNKQGFSNLLGGHVSKFVQTTPLVVNPISTGAVSVQGVPSKEYFIDVKSVKIDGQVLNLKSPLLSIDKKGNGGTKISTMSPFTELHTSVYKPFVRDFIKKALDRKLKRVASVTPFEACFDSNTIGNSVTGLVVPAIDLVLQGGVKWTIYGANSMVIAKKNVACLAFVDGGTEPRMSSVKASIVIGGYQLEDNFLEFDLASSKLSFTSSLLLHNGSCSHSSSIL